MSVFKNIWNAFTYAAKGEMKKSIFMAAVFFCALAIYRPVYADDYGNLNKFDYYRIHEMKVESEKLDPKDPIAASALSFVIPGGGLFYLGEWGTGLYWFLTEMAISLTMVTVAYNNGGASISTAIEAGFEVRYLMSIIDMCWVSSESDVINDRYYKQILCPNSPYRIKGGQKYEEKDPLIAFLLAFFTVPGIGNYYAGNSDRGKLLLTGDILGSLMCLYSLPLADTGRSKDVKGILQGLGIFFIAGAKVADIVSAPWYAAIQNDLHHAINMDIKVSLSPVIINDGMGLGLACRF